MCEAAVGELKKRLRTSAAPPSWQRRVRESLGRLPSPATASMRVRAGQFAEVEHVCSRPDKDQAANKPGTRHSALAAWWCWPRDCGKLIGDLTRFKRQGTATTVPPVGGPKQTYAEKMPTRRETIEIQAEPEAIFDLVHDYSRRLDWDPFLRGAEDFSVEPARQGRAS